IPVVPYQASEIRYLPSYSYANKVLLGVVLFPKKGSGLRPMQFDMELRAHGPRSKRYWLVSSWGPHGTAPDPSAVPASPPGALPVRQLQRPKAALEAVWLAVPAGVLGLGLAILLGFGVRGWHRNRSAVRAYRRAT